MTDFTLSPAYAETFEDLSWDLTAAAGGGAPGCRMVINGTLNIATFVAGTHYPNGYIKSGVALAKVTASGLFVPYKAGQADGSEVFVGLLAASVPVTRLLGGSNRTKIGVAILVHGMVLLSRLPLDSSVASSTTSGTFDAAARAAGVSPLIYKV